MIPFYSRNQTSLLQREDEVPYRPISEVTSRDFANWRTSIKTTLLTYRPKRKKFFVRIVAKSTRHEVVMRDTESLNTYSQVRVRTFSVAKDVIQSIRSKQNKPRPNLYERKLVGAKVISNQSRNDGNCLICSPLSLFF